MATTSHNATSVPRLFVFFFFFPFPIVALPSFSSHSEELTEKSSGSGARPGSGGSANKSTRQVPSQESGRGELGNSQTKAPPNVCLDLSWFSWSVSSHGGTMQPARRLLRERAAGGRVALGEGSSPAPRDGQHKRAALSGLWDCSGKGAGPAAPVHCGHREWGVEEGLGRGHPLQLQLLLPRELLQRPGERHRRGKMERNGVV